MKLNQNAVREWLPVAVPAAAAILLVGAYFCTSGDDEAVDAPFVAPKKDWTAARAHEAERWQEWRDRLNPSVMDETAERQRKDYSRLMTTLGTSPVEVIDPSDKSKPAFVAFDSPKQLQELLNGGAHYSGELPEGVVMPADPATADANAAAPVAPAADGATGAAGKENH